MHILKSKISWYLALLLVLRALTTSYFQHLVYTSRCKFKCEQEKEVMDCKIIFKQNKTVFLKIN